MKALCEKYLLENGADSFKKDNIGGIMQAFLPLKIEQYATKLTFEDVYYFMDDLIVKKGFLNLDFLGDLGHFVWA